MFFFLRVHVLGVIAMWKSPLEVSCMYGSKILKTYGMPHLEKVGWYLDLSKTSCPLHKVPLQWFHFPFKFVYHCEGKGDGVI